MARPRRQEATAVSIENAALELVKELGYDAVTVDMICEAAGISQRTFFNYFPTKDDALLGRDLPKINEHAARRFILSEGPLLLDALSLVRFPQDATPPANVDDRIRVAALAPSLMARQMERMGTIEKELRDIIGLRLGREHPDLPVSDREDEAMMVTHLITGIVRFTGFASREGSESLTELVDRTRETLIRVLADSAICDTSGPDAGQEG